MGRLFRAEQSEHVYIIDLHLQFLYDSFLEASNLEKHAHTLATQADIDVRIKGDYDLYVHTRSCGSSSATMPARIPDSE